MEGKHLLLTTNLLVFLLVFFLHQPAKSLPDFSFSVEAKEETCYANGELKFTVSKPGPSAVTTFAIFLLPEVTQPLKVQEADVLSNLSGGTYRIIATQEFNGETMSKQQEVTIASSYEPVNFNIISEAVCQGDDGRIMVDILSGTAISYELQGPVNTGPQTSNVFEGLPVGVYAVKVVDECGSILSKNFEIIKTGISLHRSYEFEPLLPNCGEITVGHYVTAVDPGIQYPLSLEFTVYPPGGGEEVVITEVDEGDLFEALVQGTIPFFPDEEYSYDLTVTDNCGNVASRSDHLVNRKMTVSEDMRWGAGGCGKRQLAISPLNYTAPYTINFSEYPETFDPNANTSYPGPFNDETTFFGDKNNPIPEGTYVFEVTDACGNTSEEITINHRTVITEPDPTFFNGCGPDLGSVQLLAWDYDMTLVEIRAAPSTYPHSLPHDVSENIHQNDARYFSLNNLPAGDYEFYVENECDSPQTTEVTIEGYEAENEIEVTEACDSFNLFLDYSSNLNRQSSKFGLQQLDPETGIWGHPFTGQEYVEGDELNKNNAVLLFNKTTNYNLSFSGTFRVVTSFFVWRNGKEITPGEKNYMYCLDVLKEFTIDPYQIGFSGISSFLCSDNSFDVVISATGYDPLRYKITSKNGSPFELDNGINPIFEGLEEGEYTFQIEDDCGNVLERALNVSEGYVPRIIPKNLCDGEEGELAIHGLDFLEFEWWKEDDPSTILSNSPILSFSPFDIHSDPGIYKVRMTTNDPNSCVNEVLEFEIPANGGDPNAGQGTTASLCEGEIVDLFDYLEGPFDTYGYWEEASASEGLVGNNWNSTGLPAGEYEFNYIVEGLCENEAIAKVVINLSIPPEAPTVKPVQLFCEADAPTVADLQADGDSVVWYLQEINGSPLPPAEALVNNTVYYAEEFENGCPSKTRNETKVIVEVPIQNNEISQDQAINRNTVPEPLTGSIPPGGADIYTYQWQQSIDSLNWEDISGAVQQDFTPEAISETRFFRRIIKGVCTDYISNTVQITIKTVDMSITKTSFNKKIYDGGEFNYEIYLENSGEFDATQVVISDQLPTNVTYSSSDISASSQEINAFTVTNGGFISWEIPFFPKGESLTISLAVSAVEEGTTINTVSVSSEEEDADPANNTASDENKILPMFIPNVIKPDNDGKNDYFVINSLNKFEKIGLIIFNRWGDHIFESSDYKNDWAAEGLNAGTYYYVVTATDSQAKPHIYKGWVQVIKN